LQNQLQNLHIFYNENMQISKIVLQNHPQNFGFSGAI